MLTGLLCLSRPSKAGDNFHLVHRLRLLFLQIKAQLNYKKPACSAPGGRPACTQPGLPVAREHSNQPLGPSSCHKTQVHNTSVLLGDVPTPGVFLEVGITRTGTRTCRSTEEPRGHTQV